MCCRSKIVEETERVIRVEGGDCAYKSLPEGHVYGDNNVITSQYKWYTFIPKNLSEQFSNLANLYFLLVGVFQIIPQISTTAGIPTMYQPLAFIVLVSAARALSEDISKHRADNKRNSYEYDVLRTDREEGTTEWVSTRSGDVAVGDIVRVRQNEMIPADMLFLGSSAPQGHCFIDKANLNGETKLEVYSSIRETRFFCPPIPETAGMSQAEKQVYLSLPPAPEMLDLQLELAYELPNKRFDAFRGMIVMRDEKGEFRDVRCDGHMLLMRETNLKNTDFIYGLAVYTGNDTKIQRSNLEGEKAQVKVSRVMRQVNWLLRYMFLVQAILCFIGGLLAGIWADSHGGDWYMYYNSNTTPLTSTDAIVTGILAFFTWYINLSQMVPISLIVSGEMVKFIMSIFINMDVFLYHAPIQKQAHCNSSTIHEDLGLIDYVFSDKTGTLTQNKMEFRYALVNGGAEYGSRETEIAKAVQMRNAELLERESGTYKPKPMPRWTELLRPFVPKRVPDAETHYDEDCCVKSCPRVCHGCWMNKKPVNDTINAYMPNDDAENAKTPAPVDSNSNDPIPELNCFTSAERKILLNALYGPPAAGVGAEEHASRRAALHLYMLHMTLSNTVKPFIEDGVLQFQPESAEELAMVQFAHSCGYTKLPEKEEKDKTPEERASGASTRVAIQRYDANLQPHGEPEIHAYAFLACLGFSTARARVTVIYQEATSRNILVMMKGQDTTVLPFLKVSEQRGAKFEETLLANLTDCCNNGLRTLVAGHAVRPASWWDTWGPQYAEVRDMSDEDEKLKRKMEHDLFERIETDAQPAYCGCLGMEDQLQPLVPDCIQACLRAGVKVWMITGDKLETARNIGLACNLIDADMQPQIKAGHSLSEAMAAYADSRLVHVTGEWNDIFDNSDELHALFDAIDYNKDGFVSVSEMSILLTSLHNGIREDRIRMVMDQLFEQVAQGGPLVSTTNNVTPTSTTQAYGDRPVSSQSTRERGVDKEGFLIVMRQFKRTPFEAVVYDVEEGLRRYKRIRDHDAYPISVLVNRDAFLVMFPGKPISPAQANIAVRQVQPGDAVDLSTPTEQQLEVLRRKFFFLASVSKSVIFARAQPAMKKRMVTEIQARVPSAITLAIGDGANDTDMITAAHVGVGISGVEGTAATNSADYAIGTFRMLHTLLFVHGFWSYARVSALVNFIFYKASLLAITQFLFGFYSGFSGQQFFNDAIYQLYNVMFTALPIISLAVLDKPLPKNTCEDNPAAFREQKYRVFNASVFASWMFRAVLHSCIAFFIPLYSLNEASPLAQGKTVDMWYFSTIVFFAVSFVPTFIIFFIMQSVQLFHILAVICSILAIFIVSYILNTPLFSFINPDLTGTLDIQFRSAHYWITLVLAVAIPLLLELIYRFSQRQFAPSFTQVLQEKLAISRHAEKTMNKPGVPASAPKSLQDASPDVELDVLNAEYIHVPRPIISPEEEAQWQRQTKRDDEEPPLASVLRNVTEEPDEEDEEQLRSALVRAMLRFRSHTGSQFDSAAQAQYQSHDSFASPAYGTVPGGKDLVDGVPVSRMNTLRKQRNRPERVRTSSRPRTPKSQSNNQSPTATGGPVADTPVRAQTQRVPRTPSAGSRSRSYSRVDSVTATPVHQSTDALLQAASVNADAAVSLAAQPSSRASTPKHSAMSSPPSPR